MDIFYREMNHHSDSGMYGYLGFKKKILHLIPTGNGNQRSAATSRQKMNECVCGRWHFHKILKLKTIRRWCELGIST
jgi:hypothetical protein